MCSKAVNCDDFFSSSLSSTIEYVKILKKMVGGGGGGGGGGANSKNAALMK